MRREALGPGGAAFYCDVCACVCVFDREKKFSLSKSILPHLTLIKSPISFSNVHL